MNEHSARYWPDKRTELLPLVEQITPDDALAILRSLLDGAWEETQIAPTLAGLIVGTIQRRQDDRQRATRSHQKPGERRNRG